MRTALLLIGTMLSAPSFADQLLLPDDAVISEEELETSRGGQYLVDIDYVSATSELDGSSVGNNALGTYSGNNVITNGSLSNSSGISNVIQNTGNNVVIQNSTVVNLTLH
ncbi:MULTISPECIES: carbon storage regulator [unclassified Vibrio]|uniref:carbon storage regulator n=1 Tax=unclassified Vibrio TaxID=2614977 RepID=UPI0018A0F8E6|nr:carbon storage regulator [Vibrio sp. VB16]UGA54619.1 carbon storage regulator [Vibrio sp. VB16]